MRIALASFLKRAAASGQARTYRSIQEGVLEHPRGRPNDGRVYRIRDDAMGDGANHEGYTETISVDRPNHEPPTHIRATPAADRAGA